MAAGVAYRRSIVATCTTRRGVDADALEERHQVPVVPDVSLHRSAGRRSTRNPIASKCAVHGAAPE
jgi:hypothetical protein